MPSRILVIACSASTPMLLYVFMAMPVAAYHSPFPLHSHLIPCTEVQRHKNWQKLDVARCPQGLCNNNQLRIHPESHSLKFRVSRSGFVSEVLPDAELHETTDDVDTTCYQMLPISASLLTHEADSQEASDFRNYSLRDHHRMWSRWFLACCSMPF